MNDHVDMTVEDRCTVHNQKEIGQILAELAKDKEMITISFNQGRDQCLTSIIAVNRELGVAYLDIGIDEAFNKRLLASNHIIFFKQDGIKIRWTSSSVSEVKLKDGNALKITLPKSLLRLQRREFFRLKTPVIKPVTCKIPYVGLENPAVKQDIDLTLIDVSLGGAGALVAAPMHPALVEDAQFEQCIVTFPEMGEANLTLCVRVIWQLHNANKHRVGFEFINPSRVTQALIQRYVMKLEREAIAVAKRSS